jgi:2-dehydro-3-deoxygalactonokinase
MADSPFVVGDWGTSHLRLFLCAADSTVLQRVQGPGAAQVPGAHAATLASLLAPWQNDGVLLPVVLCGMVGSSLGWVEAPYLPCPVRPEQIAAGCLSQWDDRVQIVPGLSCLNCFAAPDLMRGEETQILGALRLAPRLQLGRQLLCLPGTHTKWVVLNDGAVQEFLTAPSGELFALLREHSVLINDRNGKDLCGNEPAFAEGLQSFSRYPQAQLLHRLFECRSRRLSGEFDAHMSTAFLSGLLIASDVTGALAALGTSAMPSEVTLIGAPGLIPLYAAALEQRHIGATPIDGETASCAGLINVYRQLSTANLTHAH